MDYKKFIKHHLRSIFIIFAILVVIATLHGAYEHTDRYSLSTFGISPLVTSDCSSVKNQEGLQQASVSFNASNVSSMRDKVKALIEKYHGQIIADSFSSYPVPNMTDTSSSQDSANITVSFKQSQKEFLSELNTLIRTTGVSQSGYNWNDGSQNYGYSSYGSCTSILQNVLLYKTQLEIFTRALKEEHDPQKITLISQSITGAQTSLQSFVNSFNDFFKQADVSSVNITINSIYNSSPVPVMQGGY